MLSISEKLCLFQILILFNIFYSTAGDRKSVVKGKSVKISVDLGGRRIIKKKKSWRHRCGVRMNWRLYCWCRVLIDSLRDISGICQSIIMLIIFFFQAEDGIRDF